MVVQYLKELEDILKKNDIPKRDVILVGSAVLAFHGIRKNGDLEIVIRKRTRNRLDAEHFKVYGIWGHRRIGENVDLFLNFGMPMGYTDERLFDEKCYDERDGWKVLQLEFELAYKHFLMRYLKKRKKDVDDIRFISEKFPHIEKRKVYGGMIFLIRLQDYVKRLDYLFRCKLLNLSRHY